MCSDGVDKLSGFSGASAIILATDEAESLKKTVEIILSTCKSEDVAEIIILVCDRTTSECMKSAKEAEKMSDEVRFTVKKQSTDNVIEGIYECLEICTGSHYAVIGADMDTDPALLAKFIDKAKEKPDAVICASRWIEGGGFEGYGAVIGIKNFLAQKLVRTLFNTKLTDFTYSYRLVPIKALLGIDCKSRDKSFGLENILIFIRLGFEIIEIPAVWKNRTEGKSSRRVRDDLCYFRTIARVRMAKKEKLLAPVNRKGKE